MNRESFEGVGSIYGGEYDAINVEGVGKLKGDATVNKVTVDGMFKSKGKLTAEEVVIDGMARVFRNMKVKKLEIDGMLKVRHANVNADIIRCDGFMSCTNEVSADEITIDGICSITKLYGDRITVHNHRDNFDFGSKGQFLKYFSFLGKLYLGRKISTKYSLADVVECTRLDASRLRSKIVRADRVTLTDHCCIGKLYCNREMQIDRSCRIGEVINEKQTNSSLPEQRNNKSNNQRKQWGMERMEKTTIKKILDLYKDGKINADEAELMLSHATSSDLGAGDNKAYDISWPEDGKLRIVAFIGRKLLKKGDELARSIEVKYEGPALDVECHGNLTCGDITGNADAGGSMHCGNVGGNVDCGGSFSCGDISGNVECGGSMKCQEVHGSIDAGGGVHIMKN